MTAPARNLQESNQAGLCRELDRVYASLTGKAASIDPAADGPRAVRLENLCAVFRLTPFERDLLLLCAGCELESRFGEACAAANHDARASWPTFSLALTVLEHPHWSALGPDGSLRSWRMMDIASGAGIVRSSLRIDERILHYLTGIECLDERLRGILRPVSLPEAPTSPSYRAYADRLLECWSSTALPAVLVGQPGTDFHAIASELHRSSDRPCYWIRASDIPANSDERATVARLLTREALLTGAALFITAVDAEPADFARLNSFLETAKGAVAVALREESQAGTVAGFRIPVSSLTAAERKQLWVETLGDAAAAVNSALDRIAEYFDLDAASIRFVATAATEAAAENPDCDWSEFAWRECRIQARRSFEGLARRIPYRAGWDDLILPDLQKDTLRQLIAHVRQRPVVNTQWGFAERYGLGLGVTALFAGASGTGKTMAAEVVAGELELDLFQIDLSAVVSKYIGETEKNLRRIFDAAESSGAVLLFDEADALFGKRSEVKDSHDRYANLEISYLLQRMEAYRGLAILTTNMKHAMDTAFLRRLRFVLQFPFPGPIERRRIWERVFPTQTPLRDLDFARVSQLNVSGGVIRNIATHAAFLAADERSGVGMDHVLRAAKVEYAKLDRALTPAETGGWA